jgi:hypothetical protein
MHPHQAKVDGEYVNDLIDWLANQGICPECAVRILAMTITHIVGEPHEEMISNDNTSSIQPQ